MQALRQEALASLTFPSKAGGLALQMNNASRQVASQFDPDRFDCPNPQAGWPGDIGLRPGPGGTWQGESCFPGGGVRAASRQGGCGCYPIGRFQLKKSKVIIVPFIMGACGTS